MVRTYPIHDGVAMTSSTGRYPSIPRLGVDSVANDERARQAWDVVNANSRSATWLRVRRSVAPAPRSRAISAEVHEVTVRTR